MDISAILAPSTGALIGAQENAKTPEHGGAFAALLAMLGDARLGGTALPVGSVEPVTAGSPMQSALPVAEETDLSETPPVEAPQGDWAREIGPIDPSAQTRADAELSTDDTTEDDTVDVSISLAAFVQAAVSIPIRGPELLNVVPNTPRPVEAEMTPSDGVTRASGGPVVSVATGVPVSGALESGPEAPATSTEPPLLVQPRSFDDDAVPRALGSVDAKPLVETAVPVELQAASPVRSSASITQVPVSKQASVAPALVQKGDGADTSDETPSSPPWRTNAFRALGAYVDSDSIESGHFGTSQVRVVQRPLPSAVAVDAGPVPPAPVASAPVVTVPAASTPVAPAPVAPAPVVTVPVDSAPVVPVSVAPAPVVSAPVASTPVTPVPVESVSVAPGPVVSAPVESAKAAAVDHAVSAPLTDVAVAETKARFVPQAQQWAEELQASVVRRTANSVESATSKVRTNVPADKPTAPAGTASKAAYPAQADLAPLRAQAGGEESPGFGEEHAPRDPVTTPLGYGVRSRMPDAESLAKAIKVETAARSDAAAAVQSPGAPAARTATPPAPVQVIEQSTPVDLGDFVVRHVRMSGPDGTQTWTVRLVPESLGDLRVEVTSQDHQVSVRLVTPNGEVRDRLESQIHHLHEALAREGVEVTRVVVATQSSAGPQLMASDAGSQGGRGGHQASQPGSSGQPTQNERGWASQEDSSSRGGHQPPKRPRTALDLWA